MRTAKKCQDRRNPSIVGSDLSGGQDTTHQGTGVGGFSGWSKGKAALDARIAACRDNAVGRDGPDVGDEPTPWRLHDLRRSVVTHMAEIGIQPHIIEAVVNHISGHKGGVAGVYNRATYATEKRMALQALGDHLDQLLGLCERIVIPMRA